MKTTSMICVALATLTFSLSASALTAGSIQPRSSCSSPGTRGVPWDRWRNVGRRGYPGPLSNLENASSASAVERNLQNKLGIHCGANR